MTNDTVDLLKECDSGVKMGVSSIKDVIDKVNSEKLKKSLEHCLKEHENYGDECHRLLNDHNETGKEPNPMAKGMSWIKTNVMISMNESDETIADIMTDGCNMGVKSLHKYINKYKNADSEVKDIAEKIANSEEKLAVDIRSFL